MEARVRLVGNVGSAVEYRKPTDTMGAWATFRVAVNPGYRDRTGQWVEQSTVWMSVKCSGRLAYHVSRSVNSGDAVVVVGNLRNNTWVDKDGQPREQLQVQATTVGHDLTKGTAGFSRAPSANGSRAGSDPWDPSAQQAGPGDPETGEVGSGEFDEDGFDDLEFGPGEAGRADGSADRDLVGTSAG